VNDEQDQSATPFDDDLAELAMDSLQRLIWRLRLDQPDEWSPMLKGMIQLDLHILKLIGEKPDIILKEITTALEIPGSTLTSAINRLEKRGSLKRVISKRDRRSYGLELTKKGWTLKNEHDRVDRMLIMKVFEALEDNQQAKTFVDMLNKINEEFE
jgi:DNA-binding MarR family transcriptional regulator